MDQDHVTQFADALRAAGLALKGAPLLDDRIHRVAEMVDAVIAPGIAQHQPVIVFLAAEEIARLGEGRDPAVIFPDRIPADVIEMEMGAEDVIDLVATEADGGEAGEEILPPTTLIGIVLLWMSAIFTIYTGWDYFRAGIHHLIEEEDA